MFFPTFSHIGRNFFHSPRQEPDRRRRPPSQPGQQARRPGGEGAHGGAEGEEVPRRPQDEAPGHVQPDPAVPQDQGAAEEDPRPSQPVGQVAPRPHPPGQGGQAQGAQQVVEQPQARPGGQTPDQGPGLGLRGDAHPRKSRARRETGSSGSS